MKIIVDRRSRCGPMLTEIYQRQPRTERPGAEVQGGPTPLEMGRGRKKETDEN